MNLGRKEQMVTGVIITIILVITSIGVGYYSNRNQSPRVSALMRDKEFLEMDQTTKEKEEHAITAEVLGEIWVHIDGEVVKPGVYQLNKGARMDDLIKKAGGLTEEAASTGVNRALKLKDEGYYIIRKEGEEQESEVSGDVTQVSEATPGYQKVNINTANKYELMRIPGVGEIRAQSIIEYREKNGDFKSIEEIKNISGIGDKTFEKLRDYIDIQ